MDTSRLHAAARLGGVGRSPYDPDMLFALLVYAYTQGVRSSRGIESRCHTDVAFRYLCAQDVPDHAVIARFRRAHALALTDLLTEVLVVAVRLGMGRFGHIAIDGTKVAANASKDANRDLAGLRRLAAELVEESIAVDDEEDAEHGQRRGDELPPAAGPGPDRRQRIAVALARAEAAGQAGRDGQAQAAAERRVARAEAAVDGARAAQQERIQAWQAQRAADGICPPGRPPAAVDTAHRVRKASTRLNAARAHLQHTQHNAGQARANLTDPDSRLLPIRGGAFIQGYNCQLAVSDDHLITAVAIHDNPNDRSAFVPMMTAALATVTTLAERTSTQQHIALITADAGYDSHHNLTAPGPNRLIPATNRRATEATTRQNPTAGPPPEHATAREQMNHRLRTPDGHTAYKRRAATVEPVNGHLKDRTGLRQFLLRTTTGATIELTLAAIAHNIRRIHTHIATQPA
jgi:transposase